MPNRGDRRQVSLGNGHKQTQVFGRDGKWHVVNPPKIFGSTGGMGRGSNRASLGTTAGTIQAQTIATMEKKANARQTAQQFTNSANLSPAQAVAAANRLNNSPSPRGGNGSGATMGFGSTPAGNAWVDCILHPCMEPNPKPWGVPDKSSASVVCPLFKYSTNIAKPDAVSSTTTWDLQVVVLPIPELDFIYRGRVNAAGAWSIWFVKYAADFGQNGNVGQANTLETQGYGNQRIIGIGTTMHLRASGTANQGTVFGGQVATKDWSREYDIGFNGSVGTPPSMYTQHRVPLDSSELTAMDPGVVEMEAWNGLYMPLRYAADNWDYLAAAPGQTVNYLGAGATPTPGELPATWVQIVDSSQAAPSNVSLPTTPVYTLPSDAPTNGGAIIYGVSEATPFLTGIAFFEGLSVDASVQIKSRVYMENQPEAGTFGVTGTSNIRPFAQPSPVYDWAALEVAAIVAQSGPHAYPASANDFGTVMSSIWNTIKSVGRHVVGALDIASGLGIPYAGAIASVGKAVGL